jgi:hypothetical protein
MSSHVESKPDRPSCHPTWPLQFGRTAVVGVLAVALSVPAWASAQVVTAVTGQAGELATPLVAADPNRPSRLDASVQSARKGERRQPTLRCFQDGRLIYEGIGLAPTARTATPLDFRLAGSGAVVVQVLDLKSGLCVVETRDAP